MSKHILDKATGAEGADREKEEFARIEREQGDASQKPHVKAMHKAKSEPAGDDPRRVAEFLKQDRNSSE